MEKKETTTTQNSVQEKAEEIRTCNTCGKVLPLAKFARNRWGYTNTCTDCMSAKRGGKRPVEAKPTQERSADPKPRKCYITNVSDEELVAELRRRGYSGDLVLKREFTL